MDIDLELYRIFCEVVKYKNISKTAENMYISQSAVTQSIQKLETILGGKVFYRNKNGVELTEEGKNLYEYIKDSIETVSNAENIFSNYVNLEKGRIRIGGGNSIICSLIFKSLTEFMKKYSNIVISINSGITDVLVQKLANGELDMVVLNLPYKGKKYSNVEIFSLKKAKYCFFASKQYIKEHPVKELKEIENHTLILPKILSSKKNILDNYCKENNLELIANYEVSSSSIMRKLVLNNIGIGFTKLENLKEVIDNVEIIQEIEQDGVEEGIAVLKKNMSSKATLELVNMIKQYYNIS